jgi:MFS family permease
MTAPLQVHVDEGHRVDWPAPLRAWTAVAIFCLAALLSYTDRQILSLLVDPIRADMRISDTQVGVLQGVAFAIIYSFAGLPLGRLADMTQRRAVILAGVGLWSIGTLLCGFAGSFAMLFAGRLVVGIGEAALAPAALSMISDMFPIQRRGLAIGVFTMGMAVGGGVAIAVGGAVLGLAQAGVFAGVPLLASLASWRTVLVLLGLCGVPLLLLLASIREPRRQDVIVLADAERQGRPDAAAQLKGVSGALVPIVVGCALMSVGDFALLSWSPSLLGRRFGIAPDRIGLTLGPMIVVAGALAALGAGALGDYCAKRGGPAARLRLGMVCALLASPFALLAFAGSSGQVLAAVGLWYLFSTTAGVIGMTALQEIVPNRVRGLSASFIAFGNIMVGLGGGATLTGFLTDHLFGDPRAIGSSLTLVVLPAAIVAVLLFHRAVGAVRSLSL